MREAKIRKNHTGSVVAQDKKDRALSVESPPGPRSKRDSRDDNNNDTDARIALGRRMKIMSLNIEGLSMAKCTYLSVLLREHGVDVLALQETHLLEDYPPSRYIMDGYWIVSRNDHRHYGSAVYTRNGCQAEEVKTSMDQEPGPYTYK